MSQPFVLIVIPARLSSSRLPGKMLLAETGKPLIVHTLEAAQCSARADHVVVAAEDQAIVDAVQAAGGDAVLTGAHASGTDRVAEAARRFPQATIVVNVQGDEPEIAAADIDLAIELLSRHESAVMATLAVPIRDAAMLADPACVKVVFDSGHRALWFSRSPIPFARYPEQHSLQSDPPVFFQHVGLYAYRAEFLQKIPDLPSGRYEPIEVLEQLRVVEAGHAIQVGVIAEARKGIDTPADYATFVERHRRRTNSTAR